MKNLVLFTHVKGNKSMKLFSLSANTKLAESICEYFKTVLCKNVTLADSALTHFADGEVLFETKVPVRGEDVIILQSTYAPAYFRSVPDKAVWADVIDILPQRTVVSLVKRSGRESWEMIREIYSEELQLSGRGLKWLDRTIYRIFVQYRYATLTCLVKIYRWVFAILK